MDAADLSYRRLSGFEEYQACVEIQRETWGERSEDLVPASLLSVAVKVGGVAAGAFADDGEGDRPPEAADLAGFVFGLAGWRDGRRVHWSHMLAVRRGHRNRGIGRRLKALQRELLLEEGVEVAFWTYDPMVARNAHLNLNLLGATVDEFVVDMYGGGGSPLHVGGSTDRFVVRWELQSERVRRALAGPEGPPRSPAEARESPVVDPRRVAEGEGESGAGLPVDAPVLRLQIPADAVALGREDPEAGRRWRRGLRTLLRRYLSRGFRIDGFIPAREEDRGCYLLRRD